MPQKYIIDQKYIICQDCFENYILKTSHHCYACELETVLYEVQYFAKLANDLVSNPVPLIKERPMKPNMRHKANHG